MLAVQTPVPSGYRQYGSDIWDLYNRANERCEELLSIGGTSALRNANLQLKSDIETLCSIFSIKLPNWRVNYESGSNEIYVDFN